MSRSTGSGPDESGSHDAATRAFLALPLSERYRAMAKVLAESGHVADEVVVAVARRAHREHWPDERHYSQQLVQRVYRHVRGHVRKNPGWQRRGGGLETTTDDCASFVLVKLAAEKGETCHAERAFGDYIRKRCLDFADTLFAKKRAAGESQSEPLQESDGSDADSPAHASVEDDLIAQELEAEGEAKLQRIRELAQQDDLLTEHERNAFVFHVLGGIQIDSQDKTILTVCKLMNRKERSVRLYIKRAIAKIKEQFQ
jgi:tRNA pseudouridine-54 N-methylase